MNRLRNTLASKRLLTEPPLDIIQHLRMSRVALIQHTTKLQIRLPEAVAEVLCENPTDVRVRGVLDGVHRSAAASRGEEGVVWETVE